MIALLLVVFVLSPMPAAVSEWAPHSHALLNWDAQHKFAVQATLSEEQTTQPNLLLPIDLWLDSTPNFGGMFMPLAENNRSIFLREMRNRWPEGGFHYQREDGTDSWYVATLGALLDIARDNAQTYGRVRVLRYGNEFLPTDFLYGQGGGMLSADASAADIGAVRRDMMTYAVNPAHDILRGMSGSTRDKMAESFYAPQSTANYRLGEMDPGFLDSTIPFESLIQAQEAWRLLLLNDETRAAYTLASSSGYTSPLHYALDNMNYDRLNIITLDTLAYPAPTSSRLRMDGSEENVSIYKELLEAHGIFDSKGLAVGLMACRADYMGYITSVGGQQLSEALLWGGINLRYVSQKIDYRYPTPAPRTFLLLFIGPPDAVEAYMEALATTFDSDARFSGERGLQLQKDGKRYKGDMTFYYSNEKRSLSTFAFDYRMHLMQSVAFDSRTNDSQGVAILCDTGLVQQAGSADIPCVTLVYDPDASSGEENLITVQIDVADDPARFVGGGKYTAQLKKNLVLLGQEENTLGVVGKSDRTGEQYVLQRDRATRYGALPSEDAGGVFVQGDMTYAPAPNGGTRFMLPVSVSSDGLRPGYYRLHLTVTIGAESVNTALPAWMRPGEMPDPPRAAGEAWRWEASPGTGSWNISPTTAALTRWLKLSELMREAANKADKLGDFDHAFFSDEPPLKKNEGVDFNIPPVFQTFYLSDIFQQFQDASAVRQHTLIDYTFDLHVDFADNIAGEGIAP